jgi:peptidoglycan/xylan/chitin deacetylase (PgdA/CDA1 family)
LKNSIQTPIKRNKIVYLTFDDGPLQNTKKILEILEKYKIKATFFVIGNISPFGLRMYRSIAKRGHGIGNHTYSHHYANIYSSKKAFLADFYRMERLLRRTIGKKTRIYRFPGGSENQKGFLYGGNKIFQSIKASLARRGYIYYDWHIDSLDSIPPFPSPFQIIRKVLRESTGNKNIIVLFHDFSDNTVLALPVIIQSLKKRGYAFDVLSPYSSRIK